MRKLAHFKRKFLGLNTSMWYPKSNSFEYNGEIKQYESRYACRDYRIAIKTGKNLYLYLLFCISLIFTPSLNT